MSFFVMDTDSDPHFRSHLFPAFPSTSTSNASILNPLKKKRTKLITMSDHHLTSPANSAGILKPRYSKKPDPTAPKITRPCSECGKKFWSWKALFGHMRCHPERQWRGINPPPNFRRAICAKELETTEEDNEIAACLIMLANGPDQIDRDVTGCRDFRELEMARRKCQVRDCAGSSSCRFECSSCRKVFGSHQALGGHRASHKNVKGCFAMARSDSGFAGSVDEDMEMAGSGTDHECSISMAVFSSAHEKDDDYQPCSVGKENGCSCLDLNLPPPKEAMEDSSSSYSSELILDLRLGFN